MNGSGLRLTKWSGVLTEKLIVHPVGQEISHLSCNPNVHHRLHKSSSSFPIQSKMRPVNILQHCNTISLTSILILTSLPFGLFPSGFQIKKFVSVSHLPMRAIILTHLILLDLIILKIFGEKYNLQTSSLCNFSTVLPLHPSLVPCLKTWSVNAAEKTKHYTKNKHHEESSENCYR